MMTTYSIAGFSEPFSSILHLLGAVVFLFLTFPLLKLARGNWSRSFALSIFAFSSIFLLSISGVYHLLSPQNAGRPVLQMLDHSAIFLLIVSTITPLHQMLFKGFMRWGWLLLIWSVAITAIVLKNIFFYEMPDWLGLVLFLSLGWSGAVTGGFLWYRKGFHYIKPLLWGGLAYSIGGALELYGQSILIPGVIGSHELFHIAVLIGLSFHWRFIYDITLMQP